MPLECWDGGRSKRRWVSASYGWFNFIVQQKLTRYCKYPNKNNKIWIPLNFLSLSPGTAPDPTQSHEKDLLPDHCMQLWWNYSQVDSELPWFCAGTIKAPEEELRKLWIWLTQLSSQNSGVRLSSSLWKWSILALALRSFSSLRFRCLSNPAPEDVSYRQIGINVQKYMDTEAIAK